MNARIHSVSVLPDQCALRKRSAFTIIEVLVALALSSLLMAALYTSMSVYWSASMESYDEIERSQLARALFRQMARDIQSCTFSEQELTEDEESESQSTTADTAALDPETAMASYTSGLFGTDRDLVLYVSRPDRNVTYVSAQELLAPSDRSSDAMIIRYFLAESGSGGVSGMMAEQAQAGSRSSEPVAGLAVMQGDLIGLSTAISQGDTDLQLQASKILAPEVSLLTFSYFDGVNEVPEWDSTVQNAMPQAVIIELTLKTRLPDSETRDPSDIPGHLPETVHRLVVPVPVTPPYVGEDAL